MSQINDEVMAVLRQAMAREAQAAEYYGRSAEQVVDARGRDLLRQLADFERYHYVGLQEQHRALAHGQVPPPYVGRELAPGPEAAVDGRDAHGLETALEVLTLALEAERAAQARYEELAAETEVMALQSLFHRLAHEELVHLRILNDEFYSLSNRGVWLWGD
ncbi:MAG: ferritin family protein [Chloroflexi bacterium]|nr:ferritin family protein [Chloroflexota bacterium]